MLALPPETVTVLAPPSITLEYVPSAMPVAKV